MSKPQFLSNDDFTHVIRLAPLVSIDILVKDPDNYVLVGMRVNELAKGRYFVPGGVIRKNETIARAFKRILKVETGSRASIREAKLII
jgi:colanic acid biosynthesis protein WcaH